MNLQYRSIDRPLRIGDRPGRPDMQPKPVEPHPKQPPLCGRLEEEGRQTEHIGLHAREEFGVDPNSLPSPWQAAALSFVCFIVGAILPVIPWFTGSGNAATVASVLIGVVAAAGLGWAVGQFAERSRVKSAARQVAIMLGAAIITFSIGKLLHTSVG